MISSIIFHFNFKGLIVGFFTFIIIWILHPLIIKIEYFFGKKSWYIFLITAIVNAVLSIRIQNIFTSSLFGILTFVSLWSIFEIFQQTKRVKKGWFPKKKNTH